MRRHRSASPGTAPGVVTSGARGEVWRAVALQAHLLGKDSRPQARSASARRRQDSPQFGAAQPSRSAPCPGFRHAELDYDEKLKRHEASLTLAQRLGLVAKPSQPLTAEQWEKVKHASDSRQDSEVPCSICLDDFRTRPQVILSCSHVFHGECLRSFERFSGSRYCPLCRCPYFDATIHHSGLMVWRKKCASRIQRAWRGYRSRDQLFLQLRQPEIRAEAPTLSQPRSLDAASSC
ncbi:RNF32 [Symbiodinium pilosum]|uniref:RNF32 protein n=1 Tax=Symbiodinium pilosum TaxID=2952 RepID=A0A812SXS9_SYMPI|nr:RNF32 [Symbiodinium pilosum]